MNLDVKYNLKLFFVVEEQCTTYVNIMQKILDYCLHG